MSGSVNLLQPLGYTVQPLLKSPYNINSAAEAAVLASLEDTRLLMNRVETIVLERERLFSFLEKMSGLRPFRSGGNYILCQLSSGKINELFDRLAERGVFLRKFTHKRMSDYFRISVGLKEQNDTVLNALSELI